jgi:hypothetical protein
MTKEHRGFYSSQKGGDRTAVNQVCVHQVCVQPRP